MLLLPCTWDWWGGGSTVDTTSPLLTSNTLLRSRTWCIIFNILKERTFIEKMYPSECGRALKKYITCKGKNGCSIIPKTDAEKRQLLQRPNPNILPTLLPKAPIILCRRDYNRKGRPKSQGIFPNKSQPQPTDNTRKTTNPPQVPPSPTQNLNKHALIHTHTLTHLPIYNNIE